MINILLYKFLAYTTHGKISKRHAKITKLKDQLLLGMKTFNSLMGHIPHQIFKIIASISPKNLKL